MRYYYCIAFFLTVACTSPIQKDQQSDACLDKTCISTNAMVVTAQDEATRIGVEVLKKGGNAIDAMVAVHFALAVVHPTAGNIGGGGFMVYRTAGGESYTLDFREKAPLAASKHMYLDERKEISSNQSREGHLAAGVPGSVAGMVQAHERFGKLPWTELLAPAILLAENGFTVSQAQADDFNQHRKQFQQNNSDTTQAPLLKTKGWQAGDILVQKQLAATLKRIQQEGRKGFYEGETAKLIADDMRKHKGLITEADLQKYEAIWREPLVGDFGNYRIITMGPPSGGGVILLQLLQMSKHFPLPKWGYQSTRTVHAMAEMERRVFLDRSQYLGDPDFVNVPLTQILDSAYLARKTNTISMTQATLSHELAPMFAPGARGKEHEQTTHYSIVDASGSAVSVTTTINGAYGAMTFVAGAGFLLNNEMDDFSIKAGAPNMYGLVGGEANAIAPEKRMLSSMTPTIVEKEDRLHMVLGTPGGSTIPTSVYQVLLNVLVFDMSMTEAVWASRFHHQWLPDQIFMEEAALPEAVVDSLQSMNHGLEYRSPIGRVDAILYKSNGQWEGAADPRGEDMAGGY